MCSGPVADPAAISAAIIADFGGNIQPQTGGGYPPPAASYCGGGIIDRT